MNIFSQIIEVVLHLEKYVDIIIQTFGIFSYLILFLVIFVETGLVLTPFLPGDSLLFVAGTFAARGSFNIIILYFLLLSAAILGDTMNYWIGNIFGEKVFEGNRFFRKDYMDKTHKFYSDYGGKVIIFARFIPIVRTFAPFIAGIGKMDYWRFLSYNVIGGFIWVTLFVLGGYFFGGIPFVQANFSYFIIGIMLTSFIPVIYELYKGLIAKNKSGQIFKNTKFK